MARGLELGAELTLDTSGFMGGINGMMMSLDQFANRAMGAGTTFGDSLGEGMNTLANMAPQLAALGGQLTEFGEAGFEMMGAWADSAGDFDTAMINLQNAGIGSAEEMETLRQLAIDTGLETMFSPGEAAEAMYELKSAGLDVTQVAGVLNDVLDITAASAGQLDMASSARLGVAAMNKFGLESQDVTGFMSDLVRMQEFSQIKFSDMETAIGRLGGTVGLMGNTSQDSFLTLIAGAMNAQMSAAEAGQAIAGMERSLGIMMTTGEEGKKQRALAQLGLSLEDLQDPAGEWIDMMDMVIMMEQGMINQNLTSAQSGAILQTMFNSNGKKMIMGMMQQGRTLSVLSGEYVEGTARLEDMRQQLVETTNATDLAGAAADRHIDSWNGVKTMWEGTMDTFSIVLGETIVPLFESFAIVALTVANAILGLARENTAFRWVVIGVVAAVSALAFVVGTALTFLGFYYSVVMSIKAVTHAWALAQGILNATMWANPYVLIIAGIIALIALVASIIIYWDEWNAAVEGLTGGMIGMKEVVVIVLGALLGPIGLVGAAIFLLWDNWEQVTEGIVMACSWMGEQIAAAFWWVLDKIMGVVNWVVGIHVQMYDAGRNLIVGLWDGMKSAWTSVSDWFLSKIQWMVDLWPFSPPRAPESPLHNLQRGGAGVFTEIQAGMDSVNTDQIVMGSIGNFGQSVNTGLEAVGAEAEIEPRELTMYDDPAYMEAALRRPESVGARGSAEHQARLREDQLDTGMGSSYAGYTSAPATQYGRAGTQQVERVITLNVELSKLEFHAKDLSPEEINRVSTMIMADFATAIETEIQNGTWAVD